MKVEIDKRQEIEKYRKSAKLEILRDIKIFLEEPTIIMPTEEYLRHLKAAINDLIEDLND